MDAMAFWPLGSMLQRGVSWPVFYGYLINKLKKMESSVSFPILFIGAVCRLKKRKPTGMVFYSALPA